MKHFTTSFIEVLYTASKILLAVREKKTGLFFSYCGQYAVQINNGRPVAKFVIKKKKSRFETIFFRYCRIYAIYGVKVIKRLQTCRTMPDSLYIYKK